MRILVVDDSLALRKTLRAALETQGHEILEAGTFAFAIEILINAHIDLVLTDVHYPLRDGREPDAYGFALVRDAADCDVPAVLMSGEPPDLMLHPEARGVPFLLKPFALSELFEAVDAFAPAVR